MSLQGDSRSLILVPTQNAYMTSYSYWYSIATLKYLAAFQRYYEFCMPKATFTVTHPYSSQNYGGVPFNLE